MSEAVGDPLGLARSVAESILASPQIKPALPPPRGRRQGAGPSTKRVSLLGLGSESSPPISQMRDLKISDGASASSMSAYKSSYQNDYKDDYEPHYDDDDDDPEKNNPNLFIGDLSRTVTEEQLREVFSKYGDVAAVDIKRDKITQNNLGYGFVQFETREEAIKAKEALHGTEIGNRKIRIGWAQKNTTLFVGDLDGSVSTASLRLLFAKFGPLVEEETFVKAGSGKFGFVRFRHRGDAEKAKAEMNRKVIGSRPCRIGWGDNNIQKHCVHVQFNPTQGAHLQEAQLRKHFEQFGVVKSVSLPRFGNDRLKGYGFVHFMESSDGEKAAGKAIATIAETKVGSVTIRCSYGKRQIYNRYRRHPKHYRQYPDMMPPPPGRMMGGSPGAPPPWAQASIPPSPAFSPALAPLGGGSPLHGPVPGPHYLYSPEVRGRSLDQPMYLAQGQSFYPSPLFYAQQPGYAYGSPVPSGFGRGDPGAVAALYPPMTPPQHASFSPSSPPMMGFQVKGFTMLDHLQMLPQPALSSASGGDDGGKSGGGSGGGAQANGRSANGGGSGASGASGASGGSGGKNSGSSSAQGERASAAAKSQ